MIVVEQIDLGEIESFEEHTVDEMVGLFTHRLADMVNDSGDYEIIAVIRYDEENGVYVGAGTARHKTRDMSRETQTASYGVAGVTYEELKVAARSQGEEFFGTSQISVNVGAIVYIGEQYIATATATLL